MEFNRFIEKLEILDPIGRRCTWYRDYESFESKI